MNYIPYASSHSSGILPTTRITIPAPISTGVSLSDRFRRLPTARAPVIGGGGGGGSQYVAGLGMPQAVAVAASYPGPVDNRAFAISLAKRAQIQALQMKRRNILSQRGRGRGRINIPVTARLGTVRVKSLPQVITRGTGIRGARGRGGGRGLNFVQRTGGRIAEKTSFVLARGARGGLKGRGQGRFQRGSPTRLGSTNKANRGNAGKWTVEIKSKEDLDKELDSYMSKSKTRVRSNLDKELDDYMLAARAEAESVAAAASSAGILDNDVVMTEA